MQRLLTTLLGLLDGVTETLGRVAAWLVVALVAVTGLVVLLRYGFSYGSIALQESVLYLNTLLVVVGGAYALKHDGHVRVDVFYARLSPRGRAWVNGLGIVLLLLPAMGYVLWVSWDYVALAWRIRERSSEASGLPWVYLLKTGILVLAGLLIWQGLAELLRLLNGSASASSTTGSRDGSVD